MLVFGEGPRYGVGVWGGGGDVGEVGRARMVVAKGGGMRQAWWMWVCSWRRNAGCGVLVLGLRRT